MKKYILVRKTDAGMEFWGPLETPEAFKLFKSLNSKKVIVYEIAEERTNDFERLLDGLTIDN